MKRITKAALGGLAGCALVLGGTQAAGALSAETYTFPGPLLDLFLAGSTPFDGAEANVKIVETAAGATFRLRVTGIDMQEVEVGREFGAHLHVGTCVEVSEAQVDQTGKHYQHVPSLVATRDNEVWFDLIPDEYGVAVDQTWTPVVPEDDGIMSIVIHEKDAGALAPNPKLACLPLAFS